MAGSLILSLILWLVVQLQAAQGTKTLANLVVDVRNIPGGLAVVGDGLRTISLNAKGPAEALDRIPTDDVRPYVDLTGARASTSRSYPVRLDRVGSDKNRGITWDLRQIKLDIEKVISADVGVSVETTGALPADNLVYQGATKEPGRVTVTGPESRVKQVRRARVLLDLSKVTRGMAVTDKVDLLDSDDYPVAEVTAQPSVVTIRPEVNPAPQSKSLVVVPQYRGQPAFGYSVARVDVSPASVAATGMSEALARVSTIPTWPIDLTGLRDSRTFVVRLNPPANIQPAHTRTVSVTVTIESALAPRPPIGP
ncbi:MAG: hypothetical protein HY248_03180 [Fimbriimonas ginsengisoli]|nr:hypothetical protein [Fimbriimonas ginsengisoli]